MLYYLEQGRTEQKLIEMCVRERSPLPDVIVNRPELATGLGFFYTAFLELNTDRIEGGPLGWSSIDRYARFHRVTGEQREDLFHHLQEMDEVYTEWARKELAKKTANSAPKKARPGRRS